MGSRLPSPCVRACCGKVDETAMTTSQRPSRLFGVRPRKGWRSGELARNLTSVYDRQPPAAGDAAVGLRHLAKPVGELAKSPPTPRPTSPLLRQRPSHKPLFPTTRSRTAWTARNGPEVWSREPPLVRFRLVPQGRKGYPVESGSKGGLGESSQSMGLAVVRLT